MKGLGCQRTAIILILTDELDAEYGDLLQHNKICWLSTGKYKVRFLQLCKGPNLFLYEEIKCDTDLRVLMVTFVESLPLDSRARLKWLNDSPGYGRNYGLGNQMEKGYYNSPHFPNYGSSAGNSSSNKTLAAILLFSVLGIGATVFFVILCSKMAKQQKYDTVKGSVLISDISPSQQR